MEKYDGLIPPRAFISNGQKGKQEPLAFQTWPAPFPTCESPLAIEDSLNELRQAAAYEVVMTVVALVNSTLQVQFNKDSWFGGLSGVTYSPGTGECKTTVDLSFLINLNLQTSWCNGPLKLCRIIPPDTMKQVIDQILHEYYVSAGWEVSRLDEDGKVSFSLFPFGKRSLLNSALGIDNK